jgi:hypothetical protein
MIVRFDDIGGISDFPTAFLRPNIGPSPNVKKGLFFSQFHEGKFPIAW